MFKNKKGGGISEGIFIVIIMGVIAIIWAASNFLIADLEDDVTESLNYEQANTTFKNTVRELPNNLDGAFTVILVLFWLGAIILAFFVDTHPIWFVISVIALIMILSLAAIIANTYDDFNTEINGAANPMPKMHFVMTHLVEFIIGITATILLSLFAKEYV